jgi:hypothetical protein
MEQIEYMPPYIFIGGKNTSSFWYTVFCSDYYMMDKALKTSIDKHNKPSSELTLRKQIQLLLIFHKYVFIFG